MKYLDNNGLSYLWNRVKVLLNGKVDKAEGKGLSSNDFSAADKSKLDSLKNYTLPAATASVLGGVKVGSGLSVSNGVLSSNAVAWNQVTGKPDVALKSDLTSALSNKQDVLSGSAGQVVGFNAAGKAVAQALSNSGAKLATGTYAGTGSGSASLTFPFSVKFLYISQPGGAYDFSFLFAVCGASDVVWGYVPSQREPVADVRLNEITPSSDWKTVEVNMNASGKSYYYVAIGE